MSTDIQFCFITSPPLIIPVSLRAKRKLLLAEGVNCVMIFAELEAVIKAFPEDYIFENVEVCY